MKVRIINPDVLENLYENHGKFACVCYNTSEKYAERVGRSCQDDAHFSGSRCEYIKFHISGIDRGTAEQCLRHEIGVDVPFEMQDNWSFSDWMDIVTDVDPTHIVKNMASFRYIDKGGFEYATPDVIARHEEVKDIYEATMSAINIGRNSLKQALIEIYHEDPKEVNEAVNFVLPRATTTEFVIGFTPEALIRFMHKRLCIRAQEFIREIAKEMRSVVSDINPRFARELVPQCAHFLWCPEGKRSCGLYPTKDEVKKLIAMGKREEK